jgi:ribose transport system permease protein
MVNGLLIAKLKIPPFIATLGMLNVTKGLALVTSGLKPIYFNDTPAYNAIAMGSIPGALIPGFTIPNAVLILFGAAIIASLILTKTILGRYTFALGSNEEATRLSGVNVDAWNLQRPGRRADRLAAELGPAGAGPGLRARRDCCCRDWRHLAERR